MAMRSRGGVSITLMSRSPTSDMCSVRGMGVADMVSTSTSLRICFSRSLWRTPKRCSSSTMSRPRLELYVLGEQPMGADQDIHLARFHPLQNFFLLPGGAKAADHLNGDGEGGKARLE